MNEGFAYSEYKKTPVGILKSMENLLLPQEFM